MLKKMLSCSLCVMFAFSGISGVYAEEVTPSEPETAATVTSQTPKEVILDASSNEFLADLQADGYAELGRYKVEKIKDNIYHWDEGTKDLPGGAKDEQGNMNNPSSMYFVLSEDGVILVDLGNGSTDETDIANAKTIIASMVGNKPLSILLTHNHGDHTGWAQSANQVFEGIAIDHIYISEPDFEGAKAALGTLVDQVRTVKDGETKTIYGADYEFHIVSAHTEGSLLIKDATHDALYIGDTFGSGYIWALWDTNNGNPLAALSDGCTLARNILNEMPNASILAGHRWQQFDQSNPERPEEMSIQYFNDMAQVINGLMDGTTITEPYDVVAWAPDAIELSSNGAKAKIDTLPTFVEAYKNSVNQMDEAYIYSASDKLSIDSVNATAAPTFIIYPDGSMSDTEALQYLKDSGIQAIVDRSASKAYVARPSNGQSFTSDDVANFEAIVNKIGVSNNLKLIGIGNGATFINQNLTGYMNFVSGLALINPEAGASVNVSVPTYLVTDDQAIIDTYVKANHATLVSEGWYENPDSHYEIVAVHSDTDQTAVAATQDAWDKVLKKFGRIGNYSEVYKETATWYSRPLLSGDLAADQARKYQYFDSIDAIDNIHRYVITQDLNANGVNSLWYEYIPEQAVNAQEGTIPVVILFHGNTNDPRTQYDTSGWAQIASEEGIILICPEWQGHTYQGYTYDPMTSDQNATPDSDVIKMLKIIEEKYPQIDRSRIYISGLSAGSMNTTNAGLSDAKYFAAGAGHSGPFGASETNKQMVGQYKDQYDMPIIFFTGDGDEYLKDTFDVAGDNGGLQVAQLYQEFNDMPVTQVDEIDPDDAYLYGVPWTTRYTIEPNAENIAKIDVGLIENAKGVEIGMARIYGWGHWNYTPDARLMWEFMSKYARDLETGETIRLDLEDPGDNTPGEEVPDDGGDGTVDVEQPGSGSVVQTGDPTSMTAYAVAGIMAVVLMAGVLIIRKRRHTAE